MLETWEKRGGIKAAIPLSEKRGTVTPFFQRTQETQRRRQWSAWPLSETHTVSISPTKFRRGRAYKSCAISALEKSFVDGWREPFVSFVKRAVSQRSSLSQSAVRSSLSKVRAVCRNSALRICAGGGRYLLFLPRFPGVKKTPRVNDSFSFSPPRHLN